MKLMMLALVSVFVVTAAQAKKEEPKRKPNQAGYVVDNAGMHSFILDAAATTQVIEGMKTVNSEAGNSPVFRSRTNAQGAKEIIGTIVCVEQTNQCTIRGR